MDQNTNTIDLIRLLIVFLLCVPLYETAPTNIDCNGKSFHCLNSTHFMICVDLGGGVSSTVDDFVIPCPPTTICSPTNRFECEFPAPSETTEAATYGTTVITTPAWESINYTATFPTSLEEHLGLQNYTTEVPSETTNINGSPIEILNENNSITSVSLFDVTTEAFVTDTTTLDTTSDTNSTKLTSDVNNEPNASVTQDITTESFLIKTTSLFTSDINSTELISDTDNGITTSVLQTNVDVNTEAFVPGTTPMAISSDTNSTETNWTITSVAESKFESTTETSTIETTLPFDTTEIINYTQNESGVIGVYNNGTTVPVTTFGTIDPVVTETISTNEVVSSFTPSILEETTEKYNTMGFNATNDIVNESTTNMNSKIDNETMPATVTMASVEATMSFDTTDLVNATAKSTLLPTFVTENYNVTVSSASDQDITTAVMSTAIESSNKSDTEVSDVGAVTERETKYTTTTVNTATIPIIITENENTTDNVIDMKPTEVTYPTFTSPNDLNSTIISTAMDTTPLLNETFELYITNPISTTTQKVPESTLTTSKYVTEWMPETTSKTYFFVDETYSMETSSPATPLLTVTTESDTSLPTTRKDILSIGTTQQTEGGTTPYGYDVNVLQTQSVDITNQVHAVHNISSTTERPTTTTDIWSNTNSSNEAFSQNATTIFSNTQDTTPISDSAANYSTFQSYAPDMIEVTTEPQNVLDTNIYNVATVYPENTMVTDNNFDFSSVISTNQLNIESSTTSINSEIVTTDSAVSEIPTVTTEAVNTATIHDDFAFTAANSNSGKLSTPIPTENPPTIVTWPDLTSPELNMESRTDFTGSGYDVIFNPTTFIPPNTVEIFSQNPTHTTEVYAILSTPDDITGQSAGQNTTPENEAMTTLNLQTRPSTPTKVNVDTTSEGYEVNQSTLLDVTVSMTHENTPKTESWPSIDQPYTTSNGGVLETESSTADSFTLYYQQPLPTSVSAAENYMVTGTTETEKSLGESNTVDDKDSKKYYTTEFMNTFTEIPVYTTISEPTYIDLTTLPMVTENMENSTQNVYDHLDGTTLEKTDDQINITQMKKTTTLKPAIKSTNETELQNTTPSISTNTERNIQNQNEIITARTTARTDDINEDNTMPSESTRPGLQENTNETELKNMTLNKPTNKITTVYTIATKDDINEDNTMPHVSTRPGIPTTMPAAPVGFTETGTQGNSLTTGISITEAFPAIHTETSSKSDIIDFNCTGRNNGRYPDIHDCRKFYICNGLQVAVDHCPENTVYSDVKKKCTKDLSHCIRNKEFKCTSNGRFYDYFEQNTYYVCVKNTYTNIFVRFKFQCQNGYHFNKKSVACELNQSVTKTTLPVLSESIRATTQKSNLEKSMKYSEFECEEEGKFPDVYDCRKYYLCSRILGSEEFNMKTKYCDSDEIFDKEKKRCVDNESYECSRAGFSCENRGSGKYADSDDCGTFYACYGTHLAIRRCPQGSVFSDIKKQCTSDLCHCVRNNQFMCVIDGRFHDYFDENVYYVCVKNTQTKIFVRFKFQCQNGYHLDKATVKCEPSKTATKEANQKVSDEKGIASSSMKHTKIKHKSTSDFECEATGRFPDPKDCRKYYVCSRRNSEEYRRRRKKCDSDEVFHKDKKECVDAESYECS